MHSAIQMSIICSQKNHDLVSRVRLRNVCCLQMRILLCNLRPVDNRCTTDQVLDRKSLYRINNITVERRQHEGDLFGRNSCLSFEEIYFSFNTCFLHYQIHFLGKISINVCAVGAWIHGNNHSSFLAIASQENCCCAYGTVIFPFSKHCLNMITNGWRIRPSYICRLHCKIHLNCHMCFSTFLEIVKNSMMILVTPLKTTFTIWVEATILSLVTSSDAMITQLVFTYMSILVFQALQFEIITLPQPMVSLTNRTLETRL